MAAKTKLELKWIGKENRPRLEPRILIEDHRYSYHAKNRRAADRFDNVLIKGDNLLALKALEAEYSGRVKCIFIDPPYNTGSAFPHYDDGVEHSLWLSLMRDRLEILKNLLTPDGSIFVSIDFNEVHYLKVLMDEVFGRSNFQREIIWRIGWLSGYKTMAKNFIRNHDTILFYSKNANDAYFKKQYVEKKDFSPRFTPPQIKELATALQEKGLSKGEAGEFLAVASEIGLPDRYPLEDTWNCSIYDRLNSIAVVSFSGESVSKMLGVEELKGQKSEALLHRIISSVTEPGDIVLDSFAGTGTTGAVAHKMGRRWIMIEIGDHAETHIVPRLKKVIDNEEFAGVTKITGWQGGGGYRYFKLAPSLLEKDQFDNWVISKSYNAAMLAEAMCKHFGFTYAPSDEHYWMHGHSSETDFIYVTTNSLTHEQLAAISDEVGPERTLLICCKAFQSGNADAFGNLTIRKIPGAILDRCEWGKDDYSLKIEALPLLEDEPEEVADETPRRKSAGNPNQPGLFTGDEEIEA
ncbi:site-specific DNA-methyltransferase [Brevundimonas sp. LF-1]|uniref:site-specific DNA-methyltransferase n=1 Tax=Brevundimonas sp. LF-1 TaxID=3126100 RepID=UPI0030DFC74B